MYGCRVVQKFIEVLDLEKQLEIIDEIKDQAKQCTYDLYGNHVIQALVTKVPYPHINFIQQCALDNCIAFCMHTYGCRVIQRIFENWPSEAIQPLYDAIKEFDLLELSKDQFGNYVIQMILEKANQPEINHLVSQALASNTRKLSIHKFASNVVEKCIEHCTDDDKQTLVWSLLGDSEAAETDSELYKIMDNKYGNYVVQKAIEKSTDEQLLIFTVKINKIEQFCKELETQVSNYVKHVISCLDKCNLSRQLKLTSKLTLNDKVSDSKISE